MRKMRGTDSKKSIRKCASTSRVCYRPNDNHEVTKKTGESCLFWVDEDGKVARTVFFPSFFPFLYALSFFFLFFSLFESVVIDTLIL